MEGISSHSVGKTEFKCGKVLQLLLLRTTALFLIMGISVTILSGCYFFPKEEEVLAPPLDEPEEVTYNTVEVTKRDVFEKKVNCSGTVVSIVQKDHFFKYQGGRLKSIYVKIGDKVNKGDILAELDTDNLENRIKLQTIALHKAELAYKQISETGKLEIESVKLELNDLQRKYDKLKASSKSTQDDIESLKKQIQQQEINLRKLEASYGTGDGSRKGYALMQAEDGIEELQLQLDELKQELARSKIAADVTGDVVYVSSTKEGEFVDPYSTIVRVADPVQLKIQYIGSSSSDFSLGNEVEIAIGEKSLKGKVIATPSNMPEDVRDKVEKSVLIDVKDLPSDVTIGRTVNISLVLERSENTIVLPKNMVNSLGIRRFVHVLKDGIKSERDIELGIQTAAEVEVVKGLEVGENVIVK